jgi:flagellar hook-length control protein FliK
VALNIRSSAATSSSADTAGSSGTKTSVTDLFAQGMAAAAKSAQKSTANKAPAAPTKHTAAAPKPAAKGPSAPKPKPASKPESDDSQARSTAKSSTAPGKSKAAVPSGSAAQDDPSADDATAAAADGANAVKGRTSTRAPVKSGATQNAATTESRATADDPSADNANQSELSLLQMLAQTLEGDDSDTASTDTATASTATGKSSTDETAKTSEDPNAIALAMFTQALAAALAGQQTPTTNSASAATSDAAAGISDATESPGGAASMQDLMTVLVHDVAADAKGKSDDGAAQFNVDTSKGGANGADPAAAAANPLAQLGVASHFAAQHLRNETNTAALRAPVGSSDWNDELGTHLTWMTLKGLETGSLRVSPEHLGPVEVKISVQNGDASVWFTANHPDARAALEQALPRLREMFASQGMNLADSGVSRQSLSQQGSRDRGRSAASQSVSGVSAVAGPDGSSASASRTNLGLVDLYA